MQSVSAMGVRMAFLGALLLSNILPVYAAELVRFSDLVPESSIGTAAEDLRERGIVSGYADGTFRPGNPITRAEALKLIIASLGTPVALSEVKTSSYSDIEDTAWYLPFVETARIKGIIDGPPKRMAFAGTKSVTEAEFLKMLFAAFGVDAASTFSEIRLPLAQDVSDVDSWYYPGIRYGLAASLISAGDENLLHPSDELTRGDSALLIDRFLLYREGKQVHALLEESRKEIERLLTALTAERAEEEVWSSARALVLARGAHLSKPNDAAVQASLKIAEGFRAIVRATSANSEKNYDEAIRLAGDAWTLGERAIDLSADVKMGRQIQLLAKGLAENARQLKSSNEPTP